MPGAKLNFNVGGIIDPFRTAGAFVNKAAESFGNIGDRRRQREADIESKRRYEEGRDLQRERMNLPEKLRIEQAQLDKDILGGVSKIPTVDLARDLMARRAEDIAIDIATTPEDQREEYGIKEWDKWAGKEQQTALENISKIERSGETLDPRGRGKMIFDAAIASGRGIEGATKLEAGYLANQLQADTNTASKDKALMTAQLSVLGKSYGRNSAGKKKTAGGAETYKAIYSQINKAGYEDDLFGGIGGDDLKELVDVAKAQNVDARVVSAAIQRAETSPDFWSDKGVAKKTFTDYIDQYKTTGIPDEIGTAQAARDREYENRAAAIINRFKGSGTKGEAANMTSLARELASPFMKGATSTPFGSEKVTPVIPVVTERPVSNRQVIQAPVAEPGSDLAIQLKGLDTANRSVGRDTLQQTVRSNPVTLRDALQLGKEPIVGATQPLIGRETDALRRSIAQANRSNVGMDSNQRLSAQMKMQEIDKAGKGDEFRALMRKPMDPSSRLVELKNKFGLTTAEAQQLINMSALKQ